MKKTRKLNKKRVTLVALLAMVLFGSFLFIFMPEKSLVEGSNGYLNQEIAENFFEKKCPNDKTTKENVQLIEGEGFLLTCSTEMISVPGHPSSELFLGFSPDPSKPFTIDFSQ